LKKNKKYQIEKSKKTELPSKPININTATAQELAQLPGIGPSTAQKIVEYRQQIGKFTSIEQLLDVPRVGTLTLQRITPYITLGEEEKPSPVSPPAVVQLEKIIEEKQKFNLNTITEEELVNLGFSSTAAKNVIRYRIKVGKFISVDELYKIPYVDHSVVDKIKEKLYVE
jgi:competence ComEA-like helix-hairpin-helix protein